MSLSQFIVLVDHVRGAHAALPPRAFAHAAVAPDVPLHAPPLHAPPYAPLLHPAVDVPLSPYATLRPGLRPFPYGYPGGSSVAWYGHRPISAPVLGVY